ncbi:O-antigen ligase family protein [Janibacter alittae]|uniref:O-antigen ligase family protein n=1 Tax=Janibacter alittae TaxID=3115209 RepID=A0ABZ2MGA5_9MICO
MTKDSGRSALDVAALGVMALTVGSLPVGNVSVGPLQLIQVMTALAVLTTLTVSVIQLRLPLLPWPVGLPLGAMGVSAALATSGTPVPDVSLRINAAFAVGALLVAAMWIVVDRASHLMLLARVLVVAGAVVGVMSATSVDELTTAAGGAIVRGRAVGVFAQPNELGVFTAMLLPVAIALALARSGRQRLVASLGAASLASALVLTLSRGAWFGAAVGVLVLLMQLPDRRRTAGTLAAGLAAMGAAAWLVAPPALATVVDQRISSISSGPSENPYDERSEIYAEASRQFTDAPLTGHGPGAFTKTAHRLTQDGYDLDIVHAHSLPLVVITEYGLIGALCGIALALGLVHLLYRAWWQRRDHVTGVEREVAIVAAGLFAGLVAVLAHGMVDYPLRNPVAGTTAWLLLALAVASVRCARRTSATPAREDDA